MPGPADTYIGYGKNWANVSNTPFREYKHWTHEGGIATPLIVHWPKGIQDKNKIRTQVSHLIDLMPTCLCLAEAEYPSTYDGESIKPLEGVSLIPSFADRPLERGAIFWEHEGNRAVRDGKWKLVAKRPPGGQPANWELYDIDADRSELNNVADAYPERVQRMATQWQAYAERTGVFP